MDNGCSRHVIGYESKLSFSPKWRKVWWHLGDNANGRIIGQENVCNNTFSLIENVLFLNGLKRNILSINQLYEKCFKMIFESSYCIVKEIQDDKTIFIGHKNENVYTIDIQKYDGHDKCFSTMHNQSWLL